MKKIVPSLLLTAISLLATNAQAEFSAIGPTDPVTHFPAYITDANNLSLALCRDGDGSTGRCIFDPVIPTNPWSVTTGFGAEAFYNLANANITMPNGRRGLLVLAMEAAYLPATVADGNQNVFGRVRIRVDAPGPGVYQVFHPYMTFPGCQPNTYRLTAGARRAINDTIDIGGGFPFGAVLGAPGPFLKWDPAIAPAAPAGYVGDPLVPHAITGSKCGVNEFRIVGPNIGGAGINTVRQPLFTVSGKIAPAVATSLIVDRVTYDRTGTTTRLNVFAQSTVGATVTLSPITGLAAATNLTPDGRGNFFTQVSGTATPPTSVTITATNPALGTVATPVVAPVTDSVNVQPALYNNTTKTLSVSATSSEKATPPVLTATVGTVSVVLTRDAVTGVYSGSGPSVIPPVSVTVTSSKGGKDIENIQD